MAAKQKNIALATKLCWRFKSKPQETWAKVLTSKYLSGPRTRKYALSKTWTTILAGENICKPGSRWLIGNNCTLNFWADTWLKLGNIRSLISGPLNFGEENMHINNIYERGFWNLHNLSFLLPLQLELLIKALPIRRDSKRVNSLVWNSSSKGDFDPKDAYRLALNPLSKPSVFTNHWIWKLNITQKSNSFFGNVLMLVFLLNRFYFIGI